MKSHSVLFTNARILVIDDDADNRKLVERLLTFAGYGHVKSLDDPVIAIDTINVLHPDLIMLDLHMPKVSGYELLEQIRNDVPGGAFIPILVFTGDATPQARQKALELGASDFLTKPGEATEILLRVRNFLRTRNLHLAIEDENHALEMKVRERTFELTQARYDALACLARAAEFRDDATGAHTKRVGELSAAIGKHLGMDSDTVEIIRIAAPLHDLGKIGVPDSILLKDGELSPEEFELMKSHTRIGAEIVSASRSPVLKVAREIALYHHEWWDGTGYSAGLAGDQIPMSARIVSVADVYDALTHKRPYKEAWTQARALQEIDKHSGTQFDPAVVKAFLLAIQSEDLADAA